MNPLSPAWQTAALTRLRATGPVCRHAAEFIAAHGIRIGTARQTTGARWTLDGRIELQPGHHRPTDPHTLAFIVHEATHLEQGAALALTVAGELGGWQAQLQAYTELGLTVTDPRYLELAHLPPHPSTDDLRRARSLMLELAGYRYLIWLLPLRPTPLTHLAEWIQRLVWKGSPGA